MTNWKPSQLSVYTFKPACRFTFQHFEVNIKNLLGIELTNDLTLPFLPIVINDSCVFVADVGCEIERVGTTESNNILYISVRVTRAIKFNINENFKTWMLNFLDRSIYLT